MNGGTFGPVLYASVAAVVGKGLFGDHCSPLSDTSILSSFGVFIAPQQNRDILSRFRACNHGSWPAGQERYNRTNPRVGW
ncbi:hypothetical protein GJR98_14920 [Haloferax sp. MBLA0077]|uniref:Uncharacterized protein n=2 Tax=Haloferax TaxID=2251 RepID=A0A6G1Z616_9EURY|nr:hypothetical protein Hfx1149_14965 [Haloferax sp. CBA1149]MRW81996.1 hypothetical protein [Haloferax marinisediminis]